MAKTYKIAVIPGDGIGKEVTPWAQKALEKAAEGVADFEYENFDLGAERYLRDGAILPEDEEERIKANDAILLGAVGDPRIKAGILERGLLLKLRFDLDQYVNLRPSKLYKGVTSPLANPGDIDFVVVREGTEGLYCGAGGAVRRNTPQEVATEVSINTAYGVERVVRYAFKLAMKRKKHVTLVHKKNVLVNAGDMWQRIVDKVGEEYPEVTHDYQHIDAATIFLVSDPRWAAWATPPPAASTPPTSSRPCSSRFTVPLRTSPVRTRPTRPPPSSPPPCCSSISALMMRPRRSIPPSKRTSRSSAPPCAPPTRSARTFWPACDLKPGSPR